MNAGKGIETEARNGPPSCNTRARNPGESSLTHDRDILDLARGLSGFSLTKDSPKLLPESHDLDQLTKELSSLGKNSSVTSSAGSQPDINVPHPRGREGPSEDTSYSRDSRFSSLHRSCNQREGGSSRLGEPQVLPILRYEFPVLKLEPKDVLPESTSADRELYVKAGTPGELCVWKPDSAPSPGPSDSTWRTANFTPSIWELVHGKAQQAKNRASAALLPDNVPLFGPKISTPRKDKSRGSLKEYNQMLSDKEKTEHDDDSTFPTGSWEDDDSTSSSSEEEDYDLASLKNPSVFGEGLPGPKSQWGTLPKSETQTQSQNGPPTKGTLCAGGVPSNSTHNTRPIQCIKGPPLTKVQQESPPKGEIQTVSENGPLTKDTLSAGGVPNSSTCSIKPTKKLAIARGNQLRPEIVQALALLRASRSQSAHSEREYGG